MNASKCHKYVLLPIECKNCSRRDVESVVEKFANSFDLELVRIKEPEFTNIYWNAAMKAYLKRPRGYLRTHLVFVALAKTLDVAKRAATAWHSILNQRYVMKPLQAALVSMIQDRNSKIETSIDKK